MATTKELANRSRQKIFAEVFLQRRFPDGSYESDYMDISRYVESNTGEIRKSIDSQDFDIGIFREDNINLRFNNQGGRFNDIEDCRSFWSAFDSRHLSRVKIEYGYLDDQDEKIGDAVFIGLIDDRLIRIDGNDSVSITILSRQSVLRNLEVAGGTFSSPILASLALEIVLTRTEIIDQFNIDSIFINPDVDILIDDPSQFNGKKVDSVINEILFNTNSIGFIDSDNNFVVRSRRTGNKIIHKFYLNPEYSSQKDNVFGISGITSGRHRIKNVITWGSNQSKSISYNLQRYGVTKKTIGTNSVTNLTARQTICDRVLKEWQYPKDEFEITTDYLGDEVQLLDLCTCDIQPEYDRKSNLPFVGEAVVDEAIAVGYANGLHIKPDRGFKIISINHDMATARTTLKLREKGITNFDGYFDMLTTAIYDVIFLASSEYSINTASKGIDAQSAMVEVVDPDDEYATVALDIRRPNASTLKFVIGANATKTYKAYVLEVLET